MRRYAVVTALALCSLTGVPPARAQPRGAADAGYREAVEQAVAAHQAGRWEEARAALTRAHAIAPSARTHRALGMTEFELGNYVEAFRALSAALADERRALSEAHRAQAEALRERAAAKLGRLVLDLSSADIQITVDGREAKLEPGRMLLLPQGTHEVVVHAPGFRSFASSWTVAGGEVFSLKVELEPIEAEPPPTSTSVPTVAPRAEASARQDAPAVAQPPAGASRRWTWVVAGASGLSALTALGFGIAGRLEYDRLQEYCRTGCPRERAGEDPDLSTLRFLERGTNVALAATAITAGAAIALFLIEGRSTEREHIAVASGGSSVAVSGRF